MTSREDSPEVAASPPPIPQAGTADSKNEPIKNDLGHAVLATVAINETFIQTTVLLPGDTIGTAHGRTIYFSNTDDQRFDALISRNHDGFEVYYNRCWTSKGDRVTLLSELSEGLRDFALLT